MIVALAIPPPSHIWQLCHAPDRVALPQFAPQLARHAHQRQRINLQLSGCQRVSKHAAPVTGGQVVAGSNPVSPTQVPAGRTTGRRSAAATKVVLPGGMYNNRDNNPIRFRVHR
jgi:hypothetical protein